MTRQIFLNFRDRQANFTVRPELILNGKAVDVNVIQEIFSSNCYVAEDKLSGKGVVLDLGAYIGAFSVYAGLLGASKVYAFEPNDESYQILIDNIYNNNLENVIAPIKKAVSDTEKTTNLVDCNRDSKLSEIVELESAESKKITQGSEGKETEVLTTTLVDIVEENKIEEVDILKLDIEWGEYNVFKVVPKNIMKKIKYITMEFHGTDCKTFGELVCKLSETHVVEVVGDFKIGGFIRAKRHDL